MKKKLLFLVPVLLGMFLSACSSGGSSTNPSSDEPGGVSEPTKAQYTITFKDETGSTLESKKWDEGVVPSYSYNKVDTAEWDYTFQGWATSQNGTPLESLPVVTESVTYYAQINKVKKQYTITFESNGGTSVTSITKDYGTEIAEPTKPTKDGYRFVGWTTDSEGTKAFSWPHTLVDNVKLYAQWNEKVSIKTYLQTLLQVVGHDPYSYIPDTMRPENSDNHVTASQVNYDFNDFTNVNNI